MNNNVPAYVAPSRQVGNPGLLNDSLLAYNQVQALTAFLDGYSGGAVADSAILLAKSEDVKGDGITDDTVAINAAAQKAAAAGKILYFSSGTYRVSVCRLKNNPGAKIGIQLPDGLILQGAGVGKTIFQAIPIPAGITREEIYGNIGLNSNADFSNVMWGKDASNVKLSAFSIDGNLAQQRANFPNAALADKAITEHPYWCPTGSIGNWWEMGGVYFEGGHHNNLVNARIDNCNGFAYRYDSSPNGYAGLLSCANNVKGAMGGTQFSNLQQPCTNTIHEYFIFTNNHSDQFTINTNGMVVRNGTTSYARQCPAREGKTPANFPGIYIQGGLENVIENIDSYENSSFGLDCWDGEGTDRASYNPDPRLQRANQATCPGNTFRNIRAYRNGNGGARVVMGGVKLLDCIFSNNGRTSNGFEDPAVRNPFGIGVAEGLGYATIDNCTFFSDNGRQTAAIAKADGGNGKLHNSSITNCNVRAMEALQNVDYATCIIRDNYPVSINGADEPSGSGTLAADEFDGALSLWSRIGTTQQVYTANGNLEVVGTPNVGGNNFFGVASGVLQDLNNRNFSTQLISTFDGAGGGACFGILSPTIGFQIADYHQIRMVLEAGTLYIQDYGGHNIRTIPYAAASMSYLRFRFANNESGVSSVFYEYSGNGQSWTIAAQATIASLTQAEIDPANCRLALYAGTYQSVPAPGTARFAFARVLDN